MPIIRSQPESEFMIFRTDQAAENALDRVQAVEVDPKVKWCIEDALDEHGNVEFYVLAYREGVLWDAL